MDGTMSTAAASVLASGVILLLVILILGYLQNRNLTQRISSSHNLSPGGNSAVQVENEAKRFFSFLKYLASISLFLFILLAMLLICSDFLPRLKLVSHPPDGFAPVQSDGLIGSAT